MEKSEAIIAVLLVIAIVASIASMVIMNSKVSSVTGKATGFVNASIESFVAIILNPDTVNFGTVNQTSTHTSGSGSPEPASFGVENNGTVDLNLTVTSAGALFTGTSPVYQFNSSCAEAGCTTDTVGWTSFSGATFALGNLKFAQSTDLANVAIKITVPIDEPAGKKSDTITFTASQAA